VEVPVSTDFKTRVLEDRDVISPGRCGEIDDLGTRVVAAKEGATNAQRTGSGDGLGDGDLIFRLEVYEDVKATTYGAILEGCAVWAIRQQSSVLGEIGETSDWQVFLVRVGCTDNLVGLKRDTLNIGKRSEKCNNAYLLHAGQDVGLAVLISVCTDAEVDLPRVLVSLESFGDACDKNTSGSEQLWTSCTHREWDQVDQP